MAIKGIWSFFVFRANAAESNFGSLVEVEDKFCIVDCVIELLNDGLFEFSWLAIKDGMENTIRKRNTDAVKATQFLCIMAASGIGLFRLFFFRFNAEYKTFNNVLQCYFSSNTPVLRGAEAKREGNELGEIGYSFN